MPRPPSDIDRHVSSRLMALRRERGVSLKKLGETVGVAFQQIQKYQSGRNRMSAAMLYQLAQALNVPIGYFFEGLPEEKPDASPDALREHADHEVKVQAEHDAERRNARKRRGE